VELIISEKDNAARRIAEILSGGTAEGERVGGVDVYRWGGKRSIGLAGHVVGVDFPEEYSDWNSVDPSELIRADVVKTPTKERIVNTVKRLAGDASRVTIATDYDREGELIGKEAYELVREENESVPIDRVRFSSITENEVTEAFQNPDDLDFDLAAAGEARQIIDLIWGAALTRFLSLSAKQYGDDFISVGRVQTPTLRLLVDREREIQAFEPDDYWEIFADLQKDDEDAFEAQYYYLNEDDNEAERIWSESEADSVFSVLESADTADITEVSRRTRTDQPPAPFNTTQFIRAAGAVGFSAKRAMSLAEDLYTAGYITYPRTDNTVYPDDLDPRDLVEILAGEREFREDGRALLESDFELSPTRGEKETTDHPPIHPTGDLPEKSNLSDAEWQVYELVVRRFFATVAEPATWEHLRVTADAGGLSLKSNGKRLVDPGYHAVYPYFGTDENYVPDVSEREKLDIVDAEMEAKQTQPPRRYGQSRLVETMEEMGIGTKCLTEESPVLARNSDGEIVRRTVGELFAEGQVVLADGDTDIAVNETGPTTVSFHEQRGRITEQDGTLVSKRPLRDDERVLKFVTESGSFSVTDDHLLYVRDDDGVSVKPACEVSPGDKLLSSRRSGPEPDKGELSTVATWNEFAEECDWSTKLYAVDCNDELAAKREEFDATQREFAERFGTDRSYFSYWERGIRDPPVWLLGEVDIVPDRLRGLTEGKTFKNPFPLQWSPELARVLGNLLGDGSIRVNEDENTVVVRYHNTDRRLIDRFVADIESIFGVSPAVSERAGRESHHKTKYRVNVTSGIGRMLVYVLDSVTEDGCPEVPNSVVPWFIGALFDDEGHINSDERKAFISNTDHDLLAGVEEMLNELGIDAKLAPGQHKLHIRGRKSLEPFLDTIPIASDEKFYQGFDSLDTYDVTRHKARILQLVSQEAMTSERLATILNLSEGRVQDLVRNLRSEGYLDKQVAGSNASEDGLRTITYTATGFENSIYATLLRRPSSITVLDVSERDYEGKVYDLSIDESAPNFAVEGGAIVHNSTRHNTIDKLYDRGYVESDPPKPTGLAMGVVEAAEEYADLVVSEDMTAQLETDMTAIAEGEASLEEITEESRGMLERVFEELEPSAEEIGEHIQEALKQDKELGPCPECGERLLLRSSRGGSHFVGCDGYPDCTFTLPLPNKGNPLVLDDACEEHDLHHVKMLAGRGTFVHGCPQCQADEADEEEDEIIGACPECGEMEGGELAIKRLRSGSRLVGCTRYPDCEYSLPLPRRGDMEVTDEYCEEHDLPELVIHNGGDPWELGCPICNYREYKAEQEENGGLESISGIGEKTKEKLEQAGIDGVEDLTDADAEDLAENVDGVSASRIRDWQGDAEA
jgi:DNA topoisomerase-1